MILVAIIRTVGSNGQISIGKEYAGKLVLVEQIEPGVWVMKLGDFTPDNERWLLNPQTQQDLNEALEWAKRTSPSSTNLDDMERRIQDGQ